jgi:thiol-disulfide isomerase/thioredoxin
MSMKRIMIMVALAVIVAVSGCTSGTVPYDNSTNQSGNGTHELILLSEGTLLDHSDCVAREVDDKVVVFHSDGCPACAVAVPRLEELQGEIDYGFEFIDLSSDRERALELGLVPTHIPTVLIRCRAYVGARTKEEYRSLIEG